MTGIAGSTAAAAVLGFGALLATGLLPLTVSAIAAVIALAGLLWIAGALVFFALKEGGGETATGKDAPSLKELFAPLRDDAQLRLFILTRALLTATALAPPFLLLLAGSDGDASLGHLGPFVLASSFGTILSAWLWGRLSDRSSRRTLAGAGALSALVLGCAAATGWLTEGLGGTLGGTAAILAAQMAYEGVRSGRKLHLTDMTDDAHRAGYTALSNSLIGLVLLAGSGLGLLSDLAGLPATLALLAAFCAVAAALALRLEEVQSAPAR